MDDVTGESPAQPSALSGVGGLLAARYEIRTRLGRGATKEVYLAYDRLLDRDVALALVVGASTDPAARARVTREAQVTGRLGDHPNVITVYDSGELDGIPYLVLRAMDGGSLADLLEREPPSLDQAIRLGGEIASALAHAHAHDVIHRDVKPDNVWLTAGGSAALGDFGIAHQIGHERLTAEGVVVGTVRYLAPEQIRGHGIGAACDLYALGVTLYELVTGRAPFVAADATQILAQHLTATPVAPSRYAPAVPPPLEQLILDLLAKDPADRPPSAAAVAGALAAIAQAGGGGTLAVGDVLPWTRRSPGVGSSATLPSSTPARPPDARRLVSVLAARSSLEDPEALHGVFERCGVVIERHGGTVERYFGDALVGMFGMRESLGDEATRAARAAVELRAAAAALSIGIEAGEVFLGTGPRGETTATGAAITAAGRLAERAAQGEILLGDRIRRMVGTDTVVDVASGRLLALEAERPALLRPSATPFVGRAGELRELRAAFAQARDGPGCRLVTLVGAPGIGKSRLAGEFLTSLGDEATVLAGRCLAYGEGTTYRAIADIVRGLGEDPRARVRELLAGDEQAIRGILGAAALSNEPAQPDETAWAARRLLERLARDRPVVVAVEDIHWAQPVLLELLDHVAALAGAAAILVVCLARPELLESAPRWAASDANRSVIVLDALGDASARELAERLGADERADRIVQRAGGNPLFVEQLVAVDAGRHDGELPESLHAVLAARIDGLAADERMALERASVEGQTFHGGALATLLPARQRRDLAACLTRLARKGLVAVDEPGFPDEEAFRFAHALIRDVAYAGVPKLLRADLHADVAGWLEARPGAADEIVGFHFEQANRLGTELGRAGERERALATRAIGRFKAASRSERERGNAATASTLLERAAVLAPGVAERAELLPGLGAALLEAGRLTAASDVLDEALELPSAPDLRARALVEREFVRLEADAAAGTERAARAANAALASFTDREDRQGQYRALSLRAQVEWTRGRVSRADEAWAAAAEIAREAGDDTDLFDVLGWRATAAQLGPAPAIEAIARCEAFRARVRASPVATMWVINPLAMLHAMRGDFALAEQLLEEAAEIKRKLHGTGYTVSHQAASVRLLAGRAEVAETGLRRGVEALSAMGDSRLLSTTTAMLAQAVYAQGGFEEAGALCRQTARAAAADDIVTQVVWRGVQAKLLARDGRAEEAEALALGAVALVEPTDLLSHHGDAMVNLAEVLGMSDRLAQSHDHIHCALALYDAKGNLPAAARARSLLEGSAPDP